jgi:chromosome segregation ATPase
MQSAQTLKIYLIESIKQGKKALSAASVGAQGDKNRRALEQHNNKLAASKKEEASLHEIEKLASLKMAELGKDIDSLAKDISKKSKETQETTDSLRHEIKAKEAHSNEVTMMANMYNDKVTSKENEISRLRAIISKKREVQKKIIDRRFS